MRAADYRGAAEVAAQVATPIQIGENFNGVYEMDLALSLKACDLVMPDPQQIGGVTGWLRAAAVGLVQGLALPFRGFSRSGATISTALLARVPRRLAEDFSFALAVLLTPPIIALELHRLLRATPGSALLPSTVQLHGIGMGIVGMLFSFGAGLLALRWLSAWLEKGRWHYFGYYCVLMAAVVAVTWRWGL